MNGRAVIPTAGTLAVATTGNYFVWLGWDQLKDINPATGRATGPYQSWQVIGLVVVIAVLAVVAGWRGHPWVAIVVVPVVLTICWAFDATTGPPDPGNAGPSLWQIGAVLVAVGAFIGVAVAAGAGGISRRVLEGMHQRTRFAPKAPPVPRP